MRAFRSVPFGLLIPSALLAASGCADLPEASSDDGPSIYAPQVAPSALILSPEAGTAVTSGASLRLVGRVSDADGSPEALDATWTIDGVTVCEGSTPDIDGMVECETTAPSGAGEVALSVTDIDGLSGSHTVGLSVEAGPAPTIVIHERDVQKNYSDVAIVFTGAVGGDGALSVTFSSHQDGSAPFEIELDDDGSFTASAFLSAGDHVITATVTDEDGHSSFVGSTLFVDGENMAPDCVVLTPDSDDNTTTGDTTTLTGQVGDADVGPTALRVMWSSDTDGYLGEGELDPGTGMVSLDATLSTGTHALTLIAVDEVGGTCRDTIQHVVGEAPSIEVAGPAGMVDEGDMVEFTAEIDGAALLTAGLLVRWSAGGEVLGLSTLDNTGTTVFATDALPIGRSTVAVDITDAEGWSAVGTYEVQVNGRPTAPTMAGGGTFSGADDLVAVRTGEAKDPEDQPTVEQYQWYVNGSATSESTSLTFPAAATSRGDQIELHVTANDGRIDSAPVIVSFEIGNTVPSSTAVSIAPSAPSSSDNVLCTGTAVDIDGDAVTMKYSWWANGRQVGVGSALPAGTVAGGSALECRIDFIDGYGQVQSSSGVVTVGHSAPTLQALSFTTANATTDTVLTAGYTVTDLDKDEVRVEHTWTVNGAPAGNDQGLAGADWFEAGDTVELTVTPVDDIQRGASSTISIVIADAPVEPPVVEFADSKVREGDDLVCVIEQPGFDPDGDAVTHSIEWYKDETPWTGAVYNGDEPGDTIDGADIVEGDAWACVITASTVSDSDSGFAELTIAPPAPQSTHQVHISDVMGATDTCDGDQAVADGDFYAADVDLTYISVPAPTPLAGEDPVSAISISIDAAACDAAEGAVGTFFWSLTTMDLTDAIAEGSAPLAAPTGCACPEVGETLALSSAVEGELIVGEHQLLFAIDAATFGLLADDERNVMTITYTY